MTLDNDEKEIREYPAAELKFTSKRRERRKTFERRDEEVEGVRGKERSVKIR